MAEVGTIGPSRLCELVDIPALAPGWQLEISELGNENVRLCAKRADAVVDQPLFGETAVVPLALLAARAACIAGAPAATTFDLIDCAFTAQNFTRSRSLYIDAGVTRRGRTVVCVRAQAFFAADVEPERGPAGLLQATFKAG